MLEEQVLAEGPDTIAVISFESIVGAGGVLIPPEGFMQGVRAICDKYNILLHLDEVMVGFGRTGKLFGFQNFEGVLPDIISSAKGITSSAIPMSMTACRKPIMDFFEENSIGWGSTYQVCLYLKKRMVETCAIKFLSCSYENKRTLTFGFALVSWSSLFLSRAAPGSPCRHGMRVWTNQAPD